MYTAANDMEDFLSQQTQRDLLVRVAKLIQKETDYCPEYVDNGKTFSGLTFGKIKKSADVDEGFGLITLTGQKNELAIYFGLATLGSDFLSQYARHFPKSAMGKSCLKIRNENFFEKHKEHLIEIFKSLKNKKP